MEYGNLEIRAVGRSASKKLTKKESKAEFLSYLKEFAVLTKNRNNRVLEIRELERFRS